MGDLTSGFLTKETWVPLGVAAGAIFCGAYWAFQGGAFYQRVQDDSSAFAKLQSDFRTELPALRKEMEAMKREIAELRKTIGAKSEGVFFQHSEVGSSVASAGGQLPLGSEDKCTLTKEDSDDS